MQNGPARPGCKLPAQAASEIAHRIRVRRMLSVLRTACVLAQAGYELVVNLKTAKAIGLTIPELFVLHADQVIE